MSTSVGAAGQGAAALAAQAGTRLQMGGLQMARRIVQAEGLRGLYRGFGMSIATFVPTSGIWWGAYGAYQKLLWAQVLSRLPLLARDTQFKLVLPRQRRSGCNRGPAHWHERCGLDTFWKPCVGGCGDLPEVKLGDQLKACGGANVKPEASLVRCAGGQVARRQRRRAPSPQLGGPRGADRLGAVRWVHVGHADQPPGRCEDPPAGQRGTCPGSPAMHLPASTAPMQDSFISHVGSHMGGGFVS